MTQQTVTEPIGYRPYEPLPITTTGVDAARAHDVHRGYAAIVAAIAQRLVEIQPTKRTHRVVAIDLYQAPDMDRFVEQLQQTWQQQHGPATWFDTRTALKAPDVLEAELHEFLTDDKVFGWVCDRDLTIFFDRAKWQAFVEQINAAMRADGDEPIIIIGPGALLSPLRLYSDVAVYAQVPRETIFVASEAGRGRNLGDDKDRGPWPRYKRSFYVDWPVLNRHMFDVLPVCDFIIDMHDADRPIAVSRDAFFAGMAHAAQRPHRIRSLFMPGVWGGKRLQRFIPGLPQDWVNCAWGFEIIAPENTIVFDFAGQAFWIAYDVFMHFQARAILGAANHRRFGDFFPIRFDFLDTIEGGNLSCQVHPPDSYINASFREPFAQNEMYYVLETRPGAKVFLGLQESTSREAFLADAAKAETDHVPFDIEKHVNAWPAACGDLFMIPAGTVHCSGANNLVLEISTTPYIYTFKIYDYLRPDLSGEPRPISYARAFDVIDFTRKTNWVRENLLAKPKLLAEGKDWQHYLLTDIKYEFHSVERIELNTPAATFTDDTTKDGVHVLAIVEGDGATITREHDNTRLEATYAETIIIPAATGRYQLQPIGSVPVKVVKCYVRT